MSFRALILENIGWEESSASSINPLTRSLDSKKEPPRLQHYLQCPFLSWDQSFMDRPESIITRSSSVEVSHLLSSSKPVSPQLSLNLLESLSITEDTTKLLKVLPPTSRDWMIIRPNWSSSQDMKALQRRVWSMTPLLTKSRLQLKTPPLVFSHSQRPLPRLLSNHSPRNLRLPMSIRNLDRRELTRDTMVWDSRELRRPKIKRSEQTLLTIPRKRSSHVVLGLVCYSKEKLTSKLDAAIWSMCSSLVQSLRQMVVPKCNSKQWYYLYF